MRLLRTVTLCALGLLAVASKPLGAIELTLDEVLERALEHSHEIAVALAGLDTVAARVRRSEALLPTNPYVSASLWDTTATRFIDDRERNIDPSYTFSLSQTFEIAGQRSKRIAAARHGADVAAANAATTRANLTSGIRRTFNDTIEAHARVGLAFELLHWQRELSRAYDQSSENAKNQASIRIARAEGDYEQSQHILFLHESRMRQLLRLPPDEPLILVGDLAEGIVALPPVGALVAFALTQRADLAAHRSAAAGDDAALALTRRGAAPDITVSGFVTRSDSAGADVQFGASIGLPLPVFRSSGPDIAEAIAARSRSQADLRNMEAVVEREVREAHYGALAAAVDVERIKREVLPRMAENVRLEDEAFDRGRAGIWELVTAEIDHVQAKREQLAALRIYNNALVELERVVGGTLAEVAAGADTPPQTDSSPVSE